jgi:hypothetical protein
MEIDTCVREVVGKDALLPFQSETDSRLTGRERLDR